jgi:flavodoxin
MKWKKILVVYYSRSGNSKKVATEIARKLDSDLEEITTDVSYSGFFGYQRALVHVLFNHFPKIQKINRNLNDYDLIVIGCPIWGTFIAAPVRSFLFDYKDTLTNIAFFSTQGGMAGKKRPLKELKKILRFKPVASLVLTTKEFLDNSFMLSVTDFIFRIKNGHPKHTHKKITKNHLYTKVQTQC